MPKQNHRKENTKILKVRLIKLVPMLLRKVNMSLPHKAISNTIRNPSQPNLKRYKRPRSRISQSERDETTRAIRERMERQEKNSKKIEEQQHDRFLVRNHYNQRPDQGHINRQQSPIIKLRSFNNWVKSMLIHQYARPGDIALDLGCGKGGDLLKWNRSKVAGFIGIDIAEVSIQQAMERSKSSRLGFWAKFIVGDPFEKPIEEVLQSEIFPVDVVSCQFCLHYSFESESRARMLLSNVSRILRVGCYFIGTIPNSEVIIKHIRRLEPNTKKWGNSIYSVEFERDPPRDGNFNPPFGHKYTFFLKMQWEMFPSMLFHLKRSVRCVKNTIWFLSTRSRFKVFRRTAGGPFCNGPG